MEDDKFNGKIRKMGVKEFMQPLQVRGHANRYSQSISNTQGTSSWKPIHFGVGVVSGYPKYTRNHRYHL